MTLAFQSLFMMVLLLCTVLMALPQLFVSQHPRPTRSLTSSQQHSGIFVVENDKGQWFVDGVFQPKTIFVKWVQSTDPSLTIHYLPSDALQLHQVATSLRWLRRITPGSVVLEVMPP